MFDELLTGVPAVRTLGANDDDRDELLGARDDERDDEFLWLKVWAVLGRDKGGRSRSDGGELERLMPVLNGDGRRLLLGAGSEGVLAFARR